MNKEDTRKWYQKVDWVNSVFLSLSPFVAVAGVVYVIWHDLLAWQSVVLFIVMTLATGLAITGGYHRLFSHKSYSASWPIRLLYLMFGSAAFQNSAIKWCSDHRDHHKYVDTEKDPYNIKRGFWYAHILWIFQKRHPASEYNNVPDLREDALMRWQDKYNMLIGVLVGFGLPLFLGFLWGDPWGAFFLAGFFRIVMNHHFTFFINSLCHMIGAQPYSHKNTARDFWLLSVFTYGEGYHNFHHAFPADYRNGIKAYHWDPTKWLVWILDRVGLVRNLKRMPGQIVFFKRVRKKESELMKKFRNRKIDAVRDFNERVVRAREKFEASYLQLQEKKMEYRKLKAEKMHAFKNQMAQFNERLEQLKRDIQTAKQNFKEASENWGAVCQGVELSKI